MRRDERRARKEVVTMTVPSTRRAFLGLAAGTIGALVSSRMPALAAPARPVSADRSLGQEILAGPFTLPLLDYATYALEPHIDQRTMEIHHGKHHQAYIDNLNKVVVEHPEIAELDVWSVLTDLTIVPEAARQAVRNNLGGHVNHTVYWELMTPKSLDPSTDLVDAIKRDFGSIEEMQAAVNEAGLKRFGSGWAWVVSNGGALSVVSTPNQDNPIMDGQGFPIIGIDVWEHAYYLSYQNKRADYLTAWWNLVNWRTVDTLYGYSLDATATPAP
jgi:Fe-Mn family superoxide dismutase